MSEISELLKTSRIGQNKRDTKLDKYIEKAKIMAENKNPKDEKPQTGIYAAIVGVMGEIGAIGKDNFAKMNNAGAGFKFRGIDDVYNALNPSLKKFGVFIVPAVLECEQKTIEGNKTHSFVKVEFTAYASDGSHVSGITVGEGLDYSDKGYGKAMSTAFKYFCFEIFCIPTEEALDVENDNIPRVEKPAQNTKTQPQAQTAPPAKDNPPKPQNNDVPTVMTPAQKQALRDLTGLDGIELNAWAKARLGELEIEVPKSLGSLSFDNGTKLVTKAKELKAATEGMNQLP